MQGPRYTSYPPAPSWNSEFPFADVQKILDESNQSKRPLSLYLHLPFCEELCYFCACTTVITGPNHKLENPYVDLIIKEIQSWKAAIDSSRPVVQFHLGGGTPTYMSPENLLKIMKTVRGVFQFSEDVEVGVEVDPRVTSIEHLKILYDNGFNRLSMGVQDFNPTVQKEIHRIQTPEATEKLITEALSLGFKSVNIDLIYGLPHQTPQTFQETIEKVIQIKPTRLAVYSYAHVPWMKKYQDKFADNLPNGETKFNIFKTALQLFSQEGYEYIGMDHFALKDDEMTLARENRTLWRNFMGYTTKAGTDLVGMGMSAISSFHGGYLQNQRGLKDYEVAVAKTGCATMRGFLMKTDDKLRQRVIHNIMCHAKLIKKEIEEEFKIEFDKTFKGSLAQLEGLQKDGLVTLTSDGIEPTSLGRLFLRNLAMPFDAYLPKPGDQKMFSRTV